MFDCDIVYCLWPCVSYLSVLYCVVYILIHTQLFHHTYLLCVLMCAKLWGGGKYFSELECIVLTCIKLYVSKSACIWKLLRVNMV